MDTNKKDLNFLIESTVDSYINESILYEIKLSSLSPKLLLSYTDEVINNSFDVLIKAVKTILKGGLIGGVVGFLIKISTSVTASIKKINQVPQNLPEFSKMDKFLDYIGMKELPEIPKILETNQDKLQFFLENLKEKLSVEGPNAIASGILIGLTLALVHAVFIKKYKLYHKEAANKTINMAYVAARKADKKIGKIMKITIDEYKKLEK